MDTVTTPRLYLPRTRTLLSLLLSGLLFSACAHSGETESLLRQPIGKNAYEMAFSPSTNTLFLASAQSRKLDQGGIVYQLDPQTLQVTKIIHSELKPFGAAINRKTDTIYLGHTTNSAVSAIDTKSGKITARLLLDKRERSATVKPLAPRELVVDENSNTLYVTGLGKESVVWVIDGNNLTLRSTITNTGNLATGIALDTLAHRLYVTNADGELITIDTQDNKIINRKKLDASKEHFFLNITLDPKTQRAFITDSKQPELLVVNTQTGDILKKINMPESLAVLFNPQREEIYVTHRKAGTVSVIDAKSYQIKKSINAPIHPNSLTLSPDGKTLYVSIKQPAVRDKEIDKADDVLRITL